MSKIIFQVLSALILHCSCFNLGMVFTWPSSTLLLFKSNDTPLHRPMVDTELALLGSFSSIGALVSNPLTGIFLDRLGRKRCAIITAGMGAIAWALIAATNRVEAILIAIFLSGISGSVFLVVPVFVSEFSDESIRGTLTSGAIVFYGLGMLISYLVGGLLSYKAMVYVCLTLSVIGVMLLILLKESPTLLIRKGMEEEARKSLAFYTNSKPDSKVVLQEMLKIKRALAPEEEIQHPEEEKLKPEMCKNAPVVKPNFFRFFKNSKSTQRALFVSLTLMTASIFQGMIVLIVYAKPLFSEAVPAEILSATWCSVIMAAVSVMTGIIAAYLTDLTGRRTLMMSSSTAAGLCCVGLGTQIHLGWGPQWLTAAFIYMYCASFSFGSGTVPYVLLAELFLAEVKSVISMVVLEWTWLCNFIVLFIFNPLVAAIGLGPIFYIFAAVCFATTFFCVFFLPETKGLTVDAIQLLFVKQRRNNVI